jgi:hypothetical protein
LDNYSFNFLLLFDFNNWYSLLFFTFFLNLGNVLDLIILNLRSFLMNFWMNFLRCFWMNFLRNLNFLFYFWWFWNCLSLDGLCIQIFYLFRSDNFTIDYLHNFLCLWCWHLFLLFIGFELMFSSFLTLDCFFSDFLEICLLFNLTQILCNLYFVLLD